ncbi:MAG: tetrahydromethanopterin synthesis protein [Methylophilaceae bacterium 17-44-8]|nr:MAG: tetrahydromethanopterin synthesis protein [Methylophilales bacterium 28-44-11]OYY99346.1 MAG: tetrahydromethanopterin synthesis protein [Methylophilales bacterium 16-45-7]OZA05316.1 MAG: tetrahydromethanopterin synthesis protein [Methylophilaceae bacterium 17-44-8]
MIYETIISTIDKNSTAHVTPFGVQKKGELFVIAPFKPSTTLENIVNTQNAVMNLSDDVRIFASAVVRKQVFEMMPATKIAGFRLAETLAHHELQLVDIVEDAERPQLLMQSVYQETHRPFAGFNRAQAAVIELAVLTSRLQRLPKEKIITERAYLQIAIDKTAGERELQAWAWLIEYIDNFYAEQSGLNQA